MLFSNEYNHPMNNSKIICPVCEANRVKQSGQKSNLSTRDCFSLLSWREIQFKCSISFQRVHIFTFQNILLFIIMVITRDYDKNNRRPIHYVFWWLKQRVAPPFLALYTMMIVHCPDHCPPICFDWVAFPVVGLPILNWCKISFWKKKVLPIPKCYNNWKRNKDPEQIWNPENKNVLQ